MKKPIMIEILNPVNTEPGSVDASILEGTDGGGTVCCRCGDEWAGDVALP